MVQECIDAGSVSSWQTEELDLLGTDLMEALLGAPTAHTSAAAQQLLAALIAGGSGDSMLQPGALERVLGRALAVLRSSLCGAQQLH